MGGKRWSAGEDQLLKENYAETPTNKLVGMVNRSKYSVYHRAIHLGLESKTWCVCGRRWSASEDKFLKENYAETPVSRLVGVMGRPKTSIYHRAKYLGLKSKIGGRGGRRWTRKEKEFIKSNYYSSLLLSLANSLHRNKNSISCMAKKMKIAKPREIPFNHDHTPALAYVMGVIYGDGHCGVYPRLGRYVVGLVSTDYEFVSDFASKIEQVGLHPRTYSVHPKYPNAKPQWRLSASSKPFCTWFNSLTIDKLDTIITTDEMKREFIRGFYESEGSLNKTHRISMVNTDLKLTEFIRKIASDLGFSFSLTSTDPNRWAPTGKHYKRWYMLILLGGFRAAVKFLTEIKPVIWRKSIGKIKKESPGKLGRYFPVQFAFNVGSTPAREVPQ